MSVQPDRILWNRRPRDIYDGGEIDEIVVHDCTVHVEQMDDSCWWIGITKGDANWMGVFAIDAKGLMRFVETDNEGLVWGIDDTHETDKKEQR